jgi:hypothetical protein
MRSSAGDKGARLLLSFLSTGAVSAFEKSLAFVPELGKKMRADAEEQLKSLK